MRSISSGSTRREAPSWCWRSPRMCSSTTPTCRRAVCRCTQVTGCGAGPSSEEWVTPEAPVPHTFIFTFPTSGRSRSRKVSRSSSMRLAFGVPPGSTRHWTDPLTFNGRPLLPEEGPANSSSTVTWCNSTTSSQAALAGDLRARPDSAHRIDHHPALQVDRPSTGRVTRTLARTSGGILNSRKASTPPCLRSHPHPVNGAARAFMSLLEVP